MQQLTHRKSAFGASCCSPARPERLELVESFRTANPDTQVSDNSVETVVRYTAR